MHHLTIVVFVALLVGSESQQENIVEPQLLLAGSHYVRDTAKEIGMKIYYSQCQTCHKDSVTNIAPGLGVMRNMSTRSIVAALNNGKMRAQGALISAGERIAVAQWITNSKLKETSFS